MTNELNLISTISVAIAALLLTGCGGMLSVGSSGGDLDSVFAGMEDAIRNSNEAKFKEHWSAKGYDENLVGGSGLEGSRLFEQGARKKWYLKPEMGKVRKVEGVTIVPCEIWSWEKERSVDHVDAVVVEEGGRMVLLGAGEDSEQVDALARRHAKGEPLTPPKT